MIGTVDKDVRGYKFVQSNPYRVSVMLFKNEKKKKVKITKYDKCAAKESILDLKGNCHGKNFLGTRPSRLYV